MPAVLKIENLNDRNIVKFNPKLFY